MRNRIYKLRTGHRGVVKGIQDQTRLGYYSRTCKICGETMTRKIYPNGRYETWPRFFIRMTCSKECKRILIQADGNPNFKGIMPHCVDCGVKMKCYPTYNTKALRCMRCEGNRRKGKIPKHLIGYQYEKGHIPHNKKVI